LQKIDKSENKNALLTVLWRRLISNILPFERLNTSGVPKSNLIQSAFMTENRSFIKFYRLNRKTKTIYTGALVMMLGLIVGWWTPTNILVAFFLETVIIGLVHAVKMIYVFRSGEKYRAHKKYFPHDQNNHVAMIPFFLVHYNFFVFVQSIFIFLFLEGDGRVFKDAFAVFENYKVLLAEPGMLSAIGFMATLNIMQSVTDFFLSDKKDHLLLSDMFMQPYIRIFVQQMVAILGGFFLILTDNGLFAALLLVALKAFMDLTAQVFRESESARTWMVLKMSKGKENDPQLRRSLEKIFLN